MPHTLEAVLKRDRALVGASLAAVAILTWLYLLRMGGEMAEMETHAAMGMQAWGAVEVLLLIVMWAVMMVAMMVPAAAPMILMFATIHRLRFPQRQALTRTGIFLLGYVLVWGAFSNVAALAQWGLHRAALLAPGMVSTSPYLGALLLIAAGVFQWTPLKQTCLANCRSPISFIMTEWREGTSGALVMGLRHGAYCVGCCWMLMSLLFVAGVMNFAWIAAIAAFVLLEKVVPGGERVGRIAGGCLIVAGVALLTRLAA
jgi:predicted metal-binding membrane protein